VVTYDPYPSSLPWNPVGVWMDPPSFLLVPLFFHDDPLFSFPFPMFILNPLPPPSQERLTSQATFSPPRSGLEVDSFPSFPPPTPFWVRRSSPFPERRIREFKRNLFPLFSLKRHLHAFDFLFFFSGFQSSSLLRCCRASRFLSLIQILFPDFAFSFSDVFSRTVRLESPPKSDIET